MRLYYMVIFASTLLFILSACKPEEIQEAVESNSHACYLENVSTGQRLCVQVTSHVGTQETDVAAICESLGSDSTGYVYEEGQCATSAAVNGVCRATGIDIISTLYFYYPEYDETSAEDYCDNLGSPYSWGQADGAIRMIGGLHAEEALEEGATLEDLVNDQIIKFPEN